jgi:hypothetical protein
MAKVIPSGVIKLPNFAELDYKLKRQERQDSLDNQEWLSQFKEVEGTYLPADQAAVQGLLDDWYEGKMQQAKNPNDIKLRANVERLYSKYVKGAGAAQVIADTNRKTRADFFTNPQNYAVTGADATQIFESDALTTRNLDQIFAAASDTTPLIPRSSKVQLKTSEMLAQEALGVWDRVKDSYYDENGQLKEVEAEKWFNDWSKGNLMTNQEKQNAILSESFATGNVGYSGKLSDNDLAKVTNPQYVEQFGSDLQEGYLSRSKNNFFSNIPKNSLSQKEALELDFMRSKIRTERGSSFELDSSDGTYIWRPKTISKTDGTKVKVIGITSELVDGDYQVKTERNATEEEILASEDGQAYIVTELVPKNEFPDLGAQLRTVFNKQELKQWNNTLDELKSQLADTDPERTDPNELVVDSDEISIARQQNKYEDELGASSDKGFLRRLNFGIGTSGTSRGIPFFKGTTKSTKDVEIEFQDFIEERRKAFPDRKSRARLGKLQEIEREKDLKLSNEKLVNRAIRKGTESFKIGKLSEDEVENFKLLIKERSSGKTQKEIEKELYKFNKFDGKTEFKKSVLKDLLQKAKEMTDQEFEELNKKYSTAPTVSEFNDLFSPSDSISTENSIVNPGLTIGDELENKKKELEKLESDSLLPSSNKSRLEVDIAYLEEEVAKGNGDTILP